MARPATNPPPTTPGLLDRFHRPEVPSWLASMVIHALVLLAVAMAMRYPPQRGAVTERSAEVGIALKHTDGETEYFESEDEAGQTDSQAAETVSTTELLSDVLSQSPAEDPSDLLPEVTGAIGPTTVDSGRPLQPGARSGAPPGAGGYGGKAEVNVFGTSGVGYKFVYVFDRSLSMEGSGRSPLEVAKAEMIASFDTLEDTHQFQIVFYNEIPEVFNPAGKGRLALATEQNKELARRFVGSIMASGRTEHEAALKKAIRMQPDVIFFLTDANEPQLNGRQLYQIHRQAEGTQINTIEFGVGPRQGGENFLTKLARQNGGQYAYRDITKFSQR